MNGCDWRVGTRVHRLDPVKGKVIDGTYIVYRVEVTHEDDINTQRVDRYRCHARSLAGMLTTSVLYTLCPERSGDHFTDHHPKAHAICVRGDEVDGFRVIEYGPHHHTAPMPPTASARDDAPPALFWAVVHHVNGQTYRGRVGVIEIAGEMSFRIDVPSPNTTERPEVYVIPRRHISLMKVISESEARRREGV